jgi:hypothetical protein
VLPTCSSSSTSFYAFAVTQPSHFLLDHATFEGVFQAGVLLALCLLGGIAPALLRGYWRPQS